MIPLGYMLVKVAPPPEWMRSPNVELVYSACGCCVSRFFLDYIPLWKHNGWWFFDAPSTLHEIVSDKNLNLSEFTLFYYEAFDQEFDEDTKEWLQIRPEPSFKTDVVVPSDKTLLGYDIVSFSVHTSPECSPLSCNSLASTISTNRFCLLDDFESAFDLTQQDEVANCEPGPYRIIAVYSVEPDKPHSSGPGSVP
jgi:hypothetical protein